MNFEIYCDESGVEAMSSTHAHHYSAIGGIWMPKQFRDEFKETFKEIKDAHKIRGELKWQKVSPSYLSVYKDVLDFFFGCEHLRFRTILIESSKVDHMKYNNKDAELGFYKFYYQLLHHWIFDFNNYEIFVDLKSARERTRLNNLKSVLENSNLTSRIPNLQALPSDQSPGIQLADILTGMTLAKFNKEITSQEGKQLLINYTESNFLDGPIKATSKWEEKFNVFRIDLRGGW